MDSLCKKPFFVDGSLGRKQEIPESRRGPNMTESLCRKPKLADTFIPCEKEKSVLSLRVGGKNLCSLIVKENKSSAERGNIPPLGFLV